MAFDATAGILAALTVGISYFAWNEWTKYQAIRNTPRSTVRSIAMGQTELHGHITTDEPLEAPLTGQPAVAYTYEIERESDDVDDDGSDWHTVKSGQQTTTGKLQDETGSVAVNLDGVSIEDGHTFYERTHSFDDPSSRLKQQLDKLNVDYEGWFGGNYDMKFKETRIKPGDEVYLLGTARDNPNIADGTAANNEDDILIEEADNTFLIAQGDEASLRSNTKWTAIALVTTMAALAIATLSYIALA